jgi:hypothetical protein
LRCAPVLLFAIPCRALAVVLGFPLTNIGPALRAAVPALTSVVVDAARQIQPNDNILRAVLLGFLLTS